MPAAADDTLAVSAPHLFAEPADRPASTQRLPRPGAVTAPAGTAPAAPRHLLAATDLSTASLPAVQRALQLARATGARCTLLHALGLDALGPLRQWLGPQADDITRQAIARQMGALAALAADAGAPLDAAPALHVAPGRPASAVPAHAAATHADLVLLGAQGQAALPHWALGSTASQLLRKSHCPVLVVKQAVKGPYRRVLVAVDFSAASERCIHLVRHLAPHAHLVLLHVAELPFEGTLLYAGVPGDEIQRYRAQALQRAQRALQGLAERTGLLPGEHHAVVAHGEAVQQILAQQVRSHADLLAMGKHGIHVTEELLLGSVTKRVLAHARTDLLVVTDPQRPARPGPAADAEGETG